jgi:hypothetical protein
MRRYSPIKPSRGTTWPPEVRAEVMALDGGRCVAIRAGFGGLTPCDRYLEIDHVRASGGMGMKSRSTADNGVVLCGAHHRIKTAEGKRIRPFLLAYIERRSADCGHVDPNPFCDECIARGGLPF